MPQKPPSGVKMRPRLLGEGPLGGGLPGCVKEDFDYVNCDSSHMGGAIAFLLELRPSHDWGADCIRCNNYHVELGLIATF